MTPPDPDQSPPTSLPLSLEQMQELSFSVARSANFESRKSEAIVFFGVNGFQVQVRLSQRATKTPDPESFVVVFYEHYCRGRFARFAPDIAGTHSTSGLASRSQSVRQATASMSAATASASTRSSSSSHPPTAGGSAGGSIPFEADFVSTMDETDRGTWESLMDLYRHCLKEKEEKTILLKGFATVLEGFKTSHLFQTHFPNLLDVHFESGDVIAHLKDKRKSIAERQRQHQLKTSDSISGTDAIPSLSVFLQSLDVPRFSLDPDGGRLQDENANSAHFARQMTRNYLGDAQLRFLTFVRRHDTQAGNDLYFRGLSIV